MKDVSQYQSHCCLVPIKDCIIENPMAEEEKETAVHSKARNSDNVSLVNKIHEYSIFESTEVVRLSF